MEKYSNLSDNYCFVPVGVETYGAYGPQGSKLVKQIDKKILEATTEKLSIFYLLQSISMAIQRGKAVCVYGLPKINFKIQKCWDKNCVIPIIF